MKTVHNGFIFEIKVMPSHKREKVLPPSRVLIATEKHLAVDIVASDAVVAAS